MGDTAANTQMRKKDREVRETEAQKQREERQREDARREETIYSAEDRVTEKHARTDRCDTEIKTEGRGEAGSSQSHSGHRKDITNMSRMDSDEEAIVDFVKD